MKISTKGRYALRLMVDLALNNNGENISLKEISARQGISVKYLEQIISMLNRAGYVKSERGSNGGYRLTKKPEEYTVGMILRLTEGSLAPIACVDEDGAGCDRFEQCATFSVWKKLMTPLTALLTTSRLPTLYLNRKKKCLILLFRNFYKKHLTNILPGAIIMPTVNSYYYGRNAGICRKVVILWQKTVQ